MQPRIEILNEKKLIGKRLVMSMAANKTAELWRSFMPRRKEVLHTVSSDLISMQIYPTSFDFSQYDIRAEFTKWAAVEVTDFTIVPEDMEEFILQGGMYAVFDYKGSSTDPAIFEYIYRTWLANSAYELDNRPHFEILGDNYKNMDPDSEEEIWIPVKLR